MVRQVAVLVAALVAALVVTAPARAGDCPNVTPSQIQTLAALIGKARKAFDEGAFDRARDLLEQADGVAPTAAGRVGLGYVTLRLGDAVGALRLLGEGRALIDCPSGPRGADRDRLVAKIDAGIAEARAQLSPMRVLLETDLIGGTVLVDGRSVATTPLEGPLSMEPGSHTIVVAAAGGPRRTILVQGGSGESLTLRIDFSVDTRRTAVRVSVDVLGAEIRVDDVVVGTAPLSGLIDVPPGSHRIEAHAPGRAASAVTRSVSEGQIVDVALRMEERRSEDRAVGRTGAWVVGGTAVALGVGAAVALGMAASWRHDLQQSLDEGPPVTSLTQTEALRLQDRSNTSSQVGLGLGVAAGSAAVTAFIWWLATPSE